MCVCVCVCVCVCAVVHKHDAIDQKIKYCSKQICIVCRGANCANANEPGSSRAVAMVTDLIKYVQNILKATVDDSF